MRAIRTLLDENGGEQIGIIAKIENKEAVSNLEAIAKEADQVLVARGDLGVEIGFEKVPAVQKRIIRKCRQLGKAVIIATHNMAILDKFPGTVYQCEGQSFTKYEN